MTDRPHPERLRKSAYIKDWLLLLKIRVSVVRFHCAWMHRCREGHGWPRAATSGHHFQTPAATIWTARPSEGRSSLFTLRRPIRAHKARNNTWFNGGVHIYVSTLSRWLRSLPTMNG